MSEPKAYNRDIKKPSVDICCHRSTHNVLSKKPDINSDIQRPFRQKTLGVLVVGAGNVSCSYLDYFSENEGTQIVAVAELNSDIRKKVRDSYKISAVSDYREVLRQEDIDIVVICTPHDLHYKIAIESLMAGKHVICEKPISNSVRQADEMIDMASEKGLQLLIGLNMRFNPANVMIKQLLQEKAVGRTIMVQASYLGYETNCLMDPNHWKGTLDRAGGGVLNDGGYHIIDLLNYFLGRPKYVQACGGRKVIDIEGKGEDNISLLIEYCSGVIANLVVSFTTINVGCKAEPTLILGMNIYGTEGNILSGYDSALLKQHLDVIIPEKREHIDLINIECFDKNTHFLDCIVNGTKPLVTALDARNDTAVVEAAYESILTGHRIAVNWR